MKIKGISLLAVLFVLLLALSACVTTHEHSWIDASCAAPKTCSVCGATEGEALPHTEEIMPGREATCKEAGLTQGKKCSVCEEVIVAQTEIEKLPHTEVTVEGKPASCQNTGLTDGKKCLICGEVTLSQEIISVTGHNHELKETVNSTCTVAGKKVYECDCGDSYEEALALASHTPATAVEEGRVDSTCTVAGYYDSVVYCSVCKTYEISRTKVDLGLASHTPGAGATCTAAQECTVCHIELNPKLSHTEETLTGKPPTCTESGLTEGKKCSVCGTTTVPQETILATNHKDENKDYKCDVCKADLCTDHIAGEAKEDNRKEPSCTAEGSYDSVVQCTKCGFEISRETKTIPTVAHTPGVAATCTTAQECTVCHTELVKAQGHTPGAAATCTTTQECTVCYIVIEKAKGHTWGSGVTANDITTYTCNACGVSKAESVSLESKDNIFNSKEFEPTADAAANIYSATFGYPNLTDGSKTQESSGRFATKMKIDALMDATIDLGEKYVLNIIKFYLYDTQYAKAKEGTIGKDMLIQVYIDGKWYDVVNCADNASLCEYLTITDGQNNDYLEFNLGGIVAEKIRFYISGAASTDGITYQEIECSGALLNNHTHTEEKLAGSAATCIKSGLTDGVWCPVCKEILDAQEVIPATGHDWDSGVTANDITTYTCNACGVSKAESSKFNIADNVFTDKEFVGTDAANAQVLVASWFAGGGYEVLTDGKKSEEQIGRFSTLLNNTTAFMDATIDLGEKYVLNTIKFYLYDTQYANAKEASIGKDMLIQVYIDGKWYDVVNCADNASLCEYLTITDGQNNDYLEFNLGGIVAEKIRFYISGAVTASGITYQEIECSGALLNEHTHTEEKLTGSAATCIKSGLTDGVWCPVCKEILDAQEVIPATGHDWDSGVTSNGITTYTCKTCGLSKAESESFTTVGNLFDGKTFVPSSDAANNMYSASFGYQTLTDGIIYQEGSGRYSSKSNGGKVEASIELGAVYSLSDFKIYLHKDGLSKFGTGLVIEVLIGDNWVPVINCETPEDLQKYWVDNPDSTTMDWLVFNLGGATTSSVKFTIPGQTSTGWTTVYEIECSGAALPVTEPEPEKPEIIENVFAGKAVIPLSDTASNFCSATWGYHPYIHMIDGDFTTRYASAQNGGKSGATIDLGAVYDLYELTVYLESNLENFGTGLEIQVLFDGEWKPVKSYTVDELSAFLTDKVLTIDLGGVSARGFKFIIASHGSKGWTSFYEMTCSATKSSKIEINCEPSLIENVFAGRKFVASSTEAANNVYAITHGYLALTDSIVNQENKGRYSGKSAAGAVVGATLDLGGTYQLETFTIYLYKKGLDAFGTELKIEVFDPTTSAWKTVVHYTSTDELNTYLKAAGNGEVGPKLVFDLNSVEASQVRFTMPAGTTTSYPSMHEIACTGYAK